MSSHDASVGQVVADCSVGMYRWAKWPGAAVGFMRYCGLEVGSKGNELVPSMNCLELLNSKQINQVF